MSNWINALLNFGQGAAEAAARKQMESAPQKRKGEPPCSPCQAKANAAARMQRFGLAGTPRRRKVAG